MRFCIDSIFKSFIFYPVKNASMKKKYILYIIAAMGAGLSLSHAAENTEFNGNNGGILIKDGVWIDTNLFSNGTPSPDKDLSAYGAWGRILYNTTVEVNNLFIKGGIFISDRRKRAKFC